MRHDDDTEEQFHYPSYSNTDDNFDEEDEDYISVRSSFKEIKKKLCYFKERHRLLSTDASNFPEFLKATEALLKVQEIVDFYEEIIQNDIRFKQVLATSMESPEFRLATYKTDSKRVELIDLPFKLSELEDIIVVQPLVELEHDEVIALHRELQNAQDLLNGKAILVLPSEVKLIKARLILKNPYEFEGGES